MDSLITSSRNVERPTAKESVVSLVHVDRAPDDFLLNSPEGRDFHRACQASEIEGIRFGYFICFRQNEKICTVPYFLMDFKLNTILPNGLLKKALSWIKFKIACVGHPVSDLGEIDGPYDAEILEAVNKELEKIAPIVSYKGFPKEMPLYGFTQIVSFPMAILDINENFWENFKHGKRKSLKGQLKKIGSLKIVEATELSNNVLDELYQLYLKTLDRAEENFVILPLNYFKELVNIGTYYLFYEDDVLIGFVEMISNGEQAVSNYLGMDYNKSYLYQLYFGMVLKLVEICIKKGIRKLYLGPTSYEFKKKIGCHFVPTFVYYRHRNLIMNSFLYYFKFLLDYHE